MHILVIGQGAREHALAWKLAQSHQVQRIWVAPGNAGTEQEHKVTNIAIDPMDFQRLIDFVTQQSIGLTIVGPEAPLAAGICDFFQQHQQPCIGPSQAAAQLESSKVYSKHLMEKLNIKTPQFAVFKQADDAIHYASTQTFPLVIKVDGLANGKGVRIVHDLSAAKAAITHFLHEKPFQHACHEILIEAFIKGTEASFMILTDGQVVVPLATAKDHKTRDAHNQGPNTGGMGAYSPTHTLDDATQDQITQTIIQPTLQYLAQHNTPYCGFLFLGVMISDDGNIYALEFNCRLGDPETQVVLPRLKSDLFTILQATANKTLGTVSIEWDSRPCIGVVMAAPGYPENPATGSVIHGLSTTTDSSIKIFHAGTTAQDGQIHTSGGRVLCVTCMGDDPHQTYRTLYRHIEKINWPGCFYRNDISMHTEYMLDAE